MSTKVHSSCPRAGVALTTKTLEQATSSISLTRSASPREKQGKAGQLESWKADDWKYSWTFIHVHTWSYMFILIRTDSYWFIGFVLEIEPIWKPARHRSIPALFHNQALLVAGTTGGSAEPAKSANHQHRQRPAPILRSAAESNS